MRTFFISKENVSEVLSTLWDECGELNLNVSFNPAADEIYIKRQDGSTIASIVPLVISDEFDIKRQLKDL